jgi:YD repeat-containing protein
MMKSKRIAVLVSFLLIVAVVRLGAATQPKFRSSGSADSGLGRYLVTLAAEADSEDLAATKGELAALYGARLDPDAPAGIRQFAVTATTARARLLSSDPRVSEVIEAPATQPAPSAPAPRHFKPQTTGYGDNGQSGTYTYDSSGNITAIGTDTYLYDLQGRLKTSVTRGVEEDYTYDAFGNRKIATGATNCLGQTTCAQPVAVDAPTNRLQTINGNMVLYDAAGNLFDVAGTPSTHYVYDGTAMMTQATVGSDDRQFIYTADDERIAVKRGASWTWTVRDLNQKVLREFTSAETGGANFAMNSRVWLKDYVWRDGLLLATTTPSGTLNYHLDHLGTPRLITDANRVKVAEHAYYPFGAEINLAPHETLEEAMK